MPATMGVARVKIGGRVTRVRAPRQGSIVVLIIAVLLCLVCVGGVLLNKQRLIKKEREYTKQKNAMYEENYGAGASHRGCGQQSRASQACAAQAWHHIAQAQA